MANKNPFDGSGGKGGGRPFDMNAQANPQQSYESQYGQELGGASGTPAGGLTPFADMEKSQAINPDRAKEIGVGSVGNSQMPFRVGGGKK